MNIKNFRCVAFACLLPFALVACKDDEGISETKGGSSVSDGGATSAQFAGLYKGNMALEYKGDDLSGTDDLATSLTINANGTVSMTIKGETVGGVISGNQISINMALTHAKNGIKCTGDVLIKATVNNKLVSGPVKGDAECKLALIKRNATLTGTLNAAKQ
ncbi:MAG: hypothetical protein V3V09_03700 [Arenicellales bacterium]